MPLIPIANMKSCTTLADYKLFTSYSVAEIYLSSRTEIIAIMKVVEKTRTIIIDTIPPQ
jgi:hypothetical protein